MARLVGLGSTGTLERLVDEAVAAVRSHHLTPTELDTAERDWDEFWAAGRGGELTAAVEQRAGHLARDHALRGTDAVRLAGAIAISDPELIPAAPDRRPHAAAPAAGCRVAPADLGPCRHHTNDIESRLQRAVLALDGPRQRSGA